MSRQWIHESPAQWDASKRTIVGGVPSGIFRDWNQAEGDLVPGEWWRVEEQGQVVGYGWMEADWSDAEILLAVDPGARSHGVGTFILDQLELEAAQRGLNYLYNTVRETHPDRPGITRWLEARGFSHSLDNDRLVRQVRQKAT